VEVEWNLVENKRGERETRIRQKGQKQKGAGKKEERRTDL
jgi:hypothetical protein